MIVHALLLDLFAGRVRTPEELDEYAAAQAIAAGASGRNDGKK